MTWDISKIDEWKSDEFPRGAVIPDSGNSRDYVTGGWRSQRPVRVTTRSARSVCCAGSSARTASVIVADEKVYDFNLDHCKGCGVCAHECPFDAIDDGARGLRTAGGEVADGRPRRP